MNTYDTDIYLWSKEQIKYLIDKEFNKLDINHLIEEIESVGGSERNAVKSHMINLLLHLLKTKYQSEYSCKSWNDSINEARRQISIYTMDHPSLNTYPKDILDECYQRARMFASKETGLDIKKFPLKCEWELNELLY